MIVLDSSAVVAIVRGEAGADLLKARLAEEPDQHFILSCGNYVETGAVLAGHTLSDPRQGLRVLEAFVAQFDIELAPIDALQARLAAEARIAFGKAFGGPGGLNYGDCFAYALAKCLDAPLLYTGDDFTKTDVKPALESPA